MSGEHMAFDLCAIEISAVPHIISVAEREKKK